MGQEQGHEHAAARSRANAIDSFCATSFAQAGAVAALRGPQDSVNAMVAEFVRRRRLVVAAFADQPGMLSTSQGAFYDFPKVPTGQSDEEWEWQLLHEHGVAVVPGSAFGTSDVGHVRLSYACGQADLERSLTAMRLAS